MNKLIRAALTLLGDPGALKALLTWPRFSFASYTMTEALRRQGVQPRTVIDVGANVGQFAIAAAKQFPAATIHSFEPLPECVAVLSRNCRQLPSVSVQNLAIGETNETVEFHVNAHNHSSSVLPLGKGHLEAFPQARETSVVEVPIRRLDDLFHGSDLVRPVLLKLDVQGYEAQALRGARGILEYVDYLVMEVSFKPLYDGELRFEEMATLAKTLGFRFERPLDWLEHPATREILQMDALFCRIGG